MYTTTDTFNGQKDKILTFLKESVKNIESLENELKKHTGQNDNNVNYYACRNVKKYVT